MSFFASFRESRPKPWLRALCLSVAGMFGYSTYGYGVNQGVNALGQAAGQIARRSGRFTDRPTAPYLGAFPGRAPRTRGGAWTAAQLAEIGAVEGLENALAATSPRPAFLLHTLAVAPAPGSSYPWEGTSSASGGSVNTGNGDKLTAVNLLGWKVRGGKTLDITLYHNSETNYNDELGHGWTWTYDIYINSLSSNPVVHWGDGLSVPFTGTTTFTAPAGVYDKLVKNGDNTWSLTKKDQTVYHFTTAGFCDTVTDRNGNAITLTLNGSNYCTKVTDPTGRYVNISLDANNNFTGITDHTGRSWSFTINGSDDLTTITWPALSGSTYTDQFAYSSHRISSHTDRRGKVWSSTYNTDGSLATETDPLGHATSYTYSAASTTVTDPLSHTDVDHYSFGKLSSQTDASGYSVSFTARNSNNEVTSLTDKRGKVWGYTYDSNGNLLTQTDPLSHTQTFTYNTKNEVLTSQDALSHTTTRTYDASGNLLTVTDPLSHVTRTDTIGSYGLVSNTKDALNHSTSFTYDTNGDVATVTDPTNVVTTMVSDSLGRVTSVQDALGNTEHQAYDVWDRPTVSTHADSTYATTTYDETGDVTGRTDENGHSVSYVYDNAGRLTSFTNGVGDVESYGYDNADRRTSVTNGRGKTRTYTFTNRGEVASLTMPDGAVESWSHDGNGEVTAYTNPLSQTINYVYDNAGRQTTVDYPTGTDTTFAYDNADRRTSMADSTGTTGWTYDNASRMTALSTPQGNMSYTYDNAGRRATMVEGVGTTTYGYDNAGRVTSLANPYSETTAWTYDNDGRASRQTFSSGQTTDYGYDSRSRVTSIAHKTSGSVAISSESYVYDGAGDMSSKTVDGVTTTYAYDHADQLTGESRLGYVCTYTYDANGNRLTKTLNGSTDNYTYDDGDKMTAAGAKTYTYDAAGRTKTVVSGGNTTTLNYDYEDRLSSISYPGGGSDTYTYNGLDTRVGASGSSGTATYKRDGAGVTAPVLSDGSAAYTPGVSRRASGASTFDLHDHLGTAKVQTDSSQAVTGTRAYDAFGMLVSSTGTPVGPFGFAGAYGYQEDASGLKLLGHRYYDPSTGRFLTRDHAQDGRNWYVYCAANPVGAVDPTGLVKIIAYHYRVLGIGNHWFFVIWDNEPGSPTFGKMWYVSGYPEHGDGTPWKGANLVGSVVDGERSPYDEGAGNGGKGKHKPRHVVEGEIQLINDHSPVLPWLNRARSGIKKINDAKVKYNFMGNNSNTVFWTAMDSLGLLDALEKRLEENAKKGEWKPWAPGYGPIRN